MSIPLHVEGTRLLCVLLSHDVIPIAVAEITAVMLNHMVMVPVVNHTPSLMRLVPVAHTDAASTTIPICDFRN